MKTNPTIENFLYGDVCKVKSGFYKGCLVRVLRRRLFGLFYKALVIQPYYGSDPIRILGFRLDLSKKSSKD